MKEEESKTEINNANNVSHIFVQEDACRERNGDYTNRSQSVLGERSFAGNRLPTAPLFLSFFCSCSLPDFFSSPPLLFLYCGQARHYFVSHSPRIANYGHRVCLFANVAHLSIPRNKSKANKKK
eukprot:TRINITY_DN5858_c4_g1_i1.p1 TRINITY_DN5858_c4_g1~~TRINITY_DN5858_c4_g1_i1.p1  ORF type:complete len:124 (+),score=5.86 TRINITY_DN5858_c4_g1_i1:1379-1750(+)